MTTSTRTYDQIRDEDFILVHFHDDAEEDDLICRGKNGLFAVLSSNVSLRLADGRYAFREEDSDPDQLLRQEIIRVMDEDSVDFSTPAPAELTLIGATYGELQLKFVSRQARSTGVGFTIKVLDENA